MASVPQAGKFVLDPTKSSVSVHHKTMWGLMTVHGTFNRVSGEGELHEDGNAGGVITLDTVSLDTKNKKRDEHLRSADFFHAAAHPKIIVDITQAATSDGSNVQASGTVTVAGQTKPLTLTAKVSEATGQAVTLTADAQIDRADFGMTWNQLGMVKGPAQVHVAARFVKSDGV